MFEQGRLALPEGMRRSTLGLALTPTRSAEHRSARGRDGGCSQRGPGGALEELAREEARRGATSRMKTEAEKT